MSCCKLESERLLLRPLQAEDLPTVAKLIGEYDVAKNLSTVPYPYALSDAEAYYAKHCEKRAKGEDHLFVIARKGDERLMGQVGLHLKDGIFEMGYWLGKPYWKLGYATEAAKRAAEFAFRELKAERIAAGWFRDNPASGHVLAKLGFLPNGVEERHSIARGRKVLCNMVELERVRFGRRRKAA